MLNNEFFQNLKGEEILDPIESKGDNKPKEILEKESTTDSTENVEDFAKEKINSLNTEIEENIKTNRAEEGAILNLGGDLNELENLTSDVDFGIENICRDAIGGIVKWLKLDNPTFNEDNFYRVINENGYRDFVDSGVVRSSPTGTRGKMAGNLDIGHKSTPFPSFAKGAPDLRYAKRGEENYILESDTPMYKQGDTNPITGKKVYSKHWAYRPLNEDDSWKAEISTKEIKNVYKIDKKGDIYIKEEVENEKDTKDNIED
ncbi:MAG: hypothetical protein PHZ07_04970 [Patescibacteria group bacterium]|nr:hypothetical protein [Patescibacteria group bacterium]MDD4304701.1 hypothetical protein [Patescibacteria group bacterium]MDD4695737.1 hypothetical protein [Patescibacteria group bacterium]